MARVAAAFRLWLVGPALVAVALGATTWALGHRARLDAITKNALSEPERQQALWYLAAAAGAVAGLYAAVVVVRRLLSGLWRPAATAANLNRLLAFCLAGPFLVFLASARIESSSPALCLLLIACAGALCTPTLLLLLRPRPGPAGPARAGWQKLRERGAPALAALAVLALMAAYSVFFSRLSIVNHQALGTRTIDLGYYDNIFYQSIHGHPLACTLILGGHHASAHFDPILVLLSPLYLLYPRAELLLVLQTVWVALALVPIYLIAKHQTGSRVAGVVLGAVYALHPALHGANLYEFHSLTLLGTPLLWALYLLERGAAKRYYLLLALVLLVREDAALVMCFVGGYALLGRGRARQRMGWVTIVASLAYFAVVKWFFMPSPDMFNAGKDSLSFAYYYRDLVPEGTSFAGFVTSLVTNPVFALSIAVKEVKLVYLATMLLPVAFLPLLARPGRLMLLYGVVFLALATRTAVYSTHFQYSMLLLPFLVALTPAALERLREGRGASLLALDGRQLQGALLGCTLVLSALSAWKFGAVVENTSFRGGFTSMVRELSAEQREQYDRLRALLAMIPPEASVTVTNRLGPHVSGRAHVYQYRQKRRTQYLLVHDHDLEGQLKGWHDRRVQRREIIELGHYKQIRLFRVAEAKRGGAQRTDEARDSEPEQPGSIEVDREIEALPALPTRPPRRGRSGPPAAADSGAEPR